DRVSHVTEGEEVFIKVTRTDGSSSLYPMNGAEVTFDEEIARMKDNVSNWDVMPTSTEGCVYDTTLVHELRESGADTWRLEEALYRAQEEYGDCIRKQSKNIKSYDENEIEALRSAYRYSTELFSKISNDEEFKDKNVIFSPTSLQFALAMLANGADDDDAYAEITTALGKQDIPLDQLNEMYAKRISQLTSSNPLKIKIGVANAAFLQTDVLFGKNFLQNIEEYYKAIANNVDFTQDSTYTLMDDWAKASTDSMISEIGVTKNPYLILVLANALSFQSEWAEKFNENSTAPDKFITSKGEEKLVDKMKRSFEGGYAEGENYQLVTLNFHEGYVMNVVLPKEGTTPEDVLAKIDFDNIQYKYGHTTEAGPDTIYCPSLSLPKFSTDNKISLNKMLKEMGFENTFTKFFNNIAKDAKVNKVTQLTHLEVDENGAKGAAVTTISLEGAVCEVAYKHVKVDVNRPFIVTINNPYTHEVLFIGLINDPTLTSDY
ncbi:MAG: serpin family protein, partial [Paludibacteraceae bacterium]|nr:serpin family protein [Paludibacteraceae bacterium]